MQIANLSLVKELNSWPAGSALRLEATFADGSVRFYHKLKGPPAKGETAVLFDCEVAGGLLRIRNREDGGGMACEVSENSTLEHLACYDKPPSVDARVETHAVATKFLGRGMLPSAAVRPAGLRGFATCGYSLANASGATVGLWPC